MLLLALAAAVALWRRAHPHSRCFARGAAKPRHGSCSVAKGDPEGEASACEDEEEDEELEGEGECGAKGLGLGLGLGLGPGAGAERRERAPLVTLQPSPLSLNKGLLEAERYTPNPQYSALAAVGDALPAPALPRARLRLLNELGEGCFGKVFKGELLATEGGGVMETVAVKVLKDAASAEAEQDFLREVETMSAFRHPNILRLVGVVERDGECRPWMVFEYMPHGDLAEVLRNNSRTLWRPMPGLAPLTQEALLSVARQVAAGMRYLAEQRFVHRDLACRNCLVGAGLVVKIADFGMSRDVYTCDYYKVLGARPLPVRWMSPESIMYGRFTLESDVWSFGVVLWEIYSLGRQPYYGHSNEEVMKLIVQGIMLSCPEGCPAAVREVMRACWKTEPRDRLRFHEVHERLVKAEEEAAAAAAATAEAEAEAAAVPTTPPSTSDDTTTPASENALSPTGVESPPSLDDPCRAAGASTSSGAGGLPQPPGRVPLAQLRARAAELLDGENYLLPQQPPPQPREYLQPLPD
ncbi:hypothetical protein R5R35_011120 [Gryllus longicercus]|uniref:Protein kinase domain-containing protein n=1 Tax=Gryllus longicercus TaxID=2509291 RepID=A0AAN9VC69_9ORTH